MSKKVRILASKVVAEDIKVTKTIFKKSADMWPNIEAMQAHVTKVASYKPEIFPEYKVEKKTRTVYLKGGGSGIATYLEIREGEPELVYNTDHMDDITWEYEFIESRQIAGPVGEYVSQAESVKKAGK